MRCPVEQKYIYVFIQLFRLIGKQAMVGFYIVYSKKEAIVVLFSNCV